MKIMLLSINRFAHVEICAPELQQKQHSLHTLASPKIQKISPVFTPTCPHPNISTLGQSVLQLQQGRANSFAEWKCHLKCGPWSARPLQYSRQKKGVSGWGDVGAVACPAPCFCVSSAKLFGLLCTFIKGTRVLKCRLSSFFPSYFILFGWFSSRII